MLIHRALPLCLLLIFGFAGFIGYKVWQDPEAIQKQLFFEASNQLVSDGTNLQAIDRQILDIQAQIEQERARQQAGEIHQFFDFEARQKLLTANVATALALDQAAKGLFAGSTQTQANAEDAFYANIILNSVYTSLSQQSEQLEAYNTEKLGVNDPEEKLENAIQALRVQQTKQIEKISNLQQLKIEQARASSQATLQEDQSPEEAVKRADEILNPKTGEAEDVVTESTPTDGLSDQEMQAKPQGKFLANFPQTPGNLQKPAEGTLYHNPAGGLIIKTADRATVSAPFDGVVEFVGNFRDLGPMIILSHAHKEQTQKNHSILYGLDSLIVAKGLPVLKGEPLGFMGFEKDQKTDLFFELQVDTLRVDPLAWLE
ncbi:MAG: murein hydrolase activator EnvC family protein [Alphaproteobacteria bacterium]